MKFNSNQLIEELLIVNEKSTAVAQKLKALEIRELNAKTSPEKWSILECVEHLNRYGIYYLPVIERALLNQKPRTNKEYFKSGLIGNYLVNMVKLKPAGIKRMKTVKYMDPAGNLLSSTAIDRFLKQQERLKSLLEQAKHVNLSSAKTPITLSKFVHLRLGDTLRFMVYHIERHLVQANYIHENYNY